MLRQPARILAIAVGVVMLVVESAYATRFDSRLTSQPLAANGPMVRLPGNVLPALKEAKRIKSPPNAGKQPITLTLVLKRDHEKAFERRLHEIYDPNSPHYHHFLTQAEIASRFGPSQKSYGAVLAYLERYGLKLVQGSKNRMTLTVRGTRSMAEHAFGIHIADYQIGNDKFYANNSAPALPIGLANLVEAIIGTSNLARPRHAIAGIALPLGLLVFGLVCWSEIGLPGYNTALGGVAACYSAFESGAAAAFCSQFPQVCQFIQAHSSPAAPDASSLSLLAAPVEPGAGQKIGLLEFDTFKPSDVADYLALLGLPATDINNLSEVNVNGGVSSPGAGEKEVLLDIDAEMALAPGAHVVVYDAPFAGAGNSFQPVLNKMINDGVTVISNSWAYCEDQTSQADADSIDTLFQQAAAAGIGAFNGAGDSGSTCLDGSQNTAAVPADSPNATAVGGTSLTTGAGDIYQSETWWDGANATPPTGQGGFGVSKFFPAPAYQSGLAASRSVPDVVDQADPARGVLLCEADAGGCPDGLFYGGTSFSAPVWAAFAAILNQEVGHNLGFLNPLIYPLAGSNAFHSAASMGSDFAHAGLGSPNLSALELALSNQSIGSVSASASVVAPLAQLSVLLAPYEQAAAATYVPDDGTTKASVLVEVLDSNGHAVSGKTVTLTANSGANAQIGPASAVSNDANGAAVFTVTDLDPETVTLTATADGVTLDQQPMVTFAPPPATAGGIVASLGTNPADGTTADTITVTLKDSLNRPTPGKLVTLSQGSGHSAITAPSPDVTDSNGQAQFQVTDLINENITYAATDVTDGNLPVPGSAAVDFTNSAGGCASSQPGNVVGTVNTANGFKATTVASGFFVSNGNQGFSYNCFGAWGMAWDASGNMYVTDWPTGKIYKFDSSGGVADPAHLFTTVKAPASGVAIDPAGNMFASEASVSGPNGDIVPVDLSTGTVGTAIASGIECLGSMALDPAIPALFAIDFCNTVQGGSNNIWEVTGVDGSPSTTVYAQVPSSNAENLQITVAPDGSLYDLFCATGVGCEIERVSTASPPALSALTAADGMPITLYGSLGITPAGMQSSGDAQYIIFPQPAQDGLGQGIQTIDLTGPAPAPAVQITKGYSAGLSNFAIGPDGCLYIAGGPAVTRITNTDGTCNFGPTTQPPTISLTPTTVSPNPTQGGSQSFTASFHGASVPAGTPIVLTVTGDNHQVRIGRTDAAGQTSFSYTGLESGNDNVVASATVNNAIVNSNPVQVTWNSGPDTTFLTLNPSPKDGMPGLPVTFVANLTDISQNPQVPLSGEPITISLGTDSCNASTDANGNASCTIPMPTIIPGSPNRPLTATFAGTSSLTASNASASFTFVAPPEHAQLIVGPIPRYFPNTVELGGVGATSPIRRVTVYNPKKIKTKISVTFLGADNGGVNGGDFNILDPPATTCGDSLAPRSYCKIALTFTPTAPGLRKGRLIIADNAERNTPQKVPLRGVGVKGHIRFTPDELLFGKELIGNTSGEQTVTVKNHNPLPMTFAAATRGDFQITFNGCPSTLPAAPSSTTPYTCQISVDFHPTAAGPLYGALVFTDDAAQSPQKVHLSGTGVP